MKKLWPNKKSHQLWFLGALLLPLTACNVGPGSVGPTPYSDAYRVNFTALGYSVVRGKAAVAGIPAVPAVPAIPETPTTPAVPAVPAIPAVPGTPATPDVYTIPAVNATVSSTAGAPDIRALDYTAVLLDSKGKPAALNNSLIVPANGNLLVGGKGGYRCTEDKDDSRLTQDKCIVTRPDAIWNTNSSWIVNNAVNKAIIPIEWAVNHDFGQNGDTAQWYVEFTFTAEMSTNQSVSWKQRYQFTSPAGK